MTESTQPTDESLPEKLAIHGGSIHGVGVSMYLSRESEFYRKKDTEGGGNSRTLTINECQRLTYKSIVIIQIKAIKKLIN